jgi:purine-cytosine permease-like protein
MGYWPAKLPTLLNVVLMVGYTTIDCIIGGQVLSAVSGGSMTILVGVVVVALMTWVIAVFGMAIFHRYERYALPTVGAWMQDGADNIS